MRHMARQHHPGREHVTRECFRDVEYRIILYFVFDVVEFAGREDRVFSEGEKETGSRGTPD